MNKHLMFVICYKTKTMAYPEIVVTKTQELVVIGIKHTAKAILGTEVKSRVLFGGTTDYFQDFPRVCRV